MLQARLFRECMLRTWDQRILSCGPDSQIVLRPFFLWIRCVDILGSVERLLKHNSLFSPAKTGFEEAGAGKSKWFRR